eukprot:CAMPEP_0198686096 /NCGR_PEP_ID=MMETSP1468-20131203/14478_1 /TAXON_ID=1461545 /ORGANISM="Mantoniella sp, Strain CCMP1436" /LENGTH=292 /DNA_ID=CAMNT_0044431969 /DNA_START=182 /DNA_END=1057 /DNA_ORIENTATION=+
MCHLTSTATLKNATPQRVDRSNWDGLRGQCRNSAVGRALPRIAPTAVGTPPFLTRHVSWLFTRASPGLIHERGNLTLPHDHPISSFSAAPTPSKPALSGIGAPRASGGRALNTSLSLTSVTFTRSALFVARPQRYQVTPRGGGAICTLSAPVCTTRGPDPRLQYFTAPMCATRGPDPRLHFGFATGLAKVLRSSHHSSVAHRLQLGPDLSLLGAGIALGRRGATLWRVLDPSACGAVPPLVVTGLLAASRFLTRASASSSGSHASVWPWLTALRASGGMGSGGVPREVVATA